METLTTAERAAVLGALDMVLQGMSDAIAEMADDTATLSDMDTYLETMGDAHAEKGLIESAIRKLTHEYNPGRERATSPVRTLLQGLRGYARRSKVRSTR